MRAGILEQWWSRRAMCRPVTYYDDQIGVQVSYYNDQIVVQMAYFDDLIGVQVPYK
jgi:hypothetical protein